MRQKSLRYPQHQYITSTIRKIIKTNATIWYVPELFKLTIKSAACLCYSSEYRMLVSATNFWATNLADTTNSALEFEGSKCAYSMTIFSTWGAPCWGENKQVWKGKKHLLFSMFHSHSQSKPAWMIHCKNKLRPWMKSAAPILLFLGLWNILCSLHSNGRTTAISQYYYRVVCSLYKWRQMQAVVIIQTLHHNNVERVHSR